MFFFRLFIHKGFDTMELLDLLNERGDIIGRASRDACHSGTFLIHGVVHVLVFTSSGAVLLQKRSMTRSINPGVWDTSIGGHIEAGETVEEALKREAEEELGITGDVFKSMYSYVMTSDIERQFVTTFRCVWDSPVSYQKEEIDEVRLFTVKEVESRLKSGFFSPYFEEEWKRCKLWLAAGERC